MHPTYNLQAQLQLFAIFGSGLVHWTKACVQAFSASAAAVYFWQICGIALILTAYMMHKI